MQIVNMKYENLIQHFIIYVRLNPSSFLWEYFILPINEEILPYVNCIKEYYSIEDNCVTFMSFSIIKEVMYDSSYMRCEFQEDENLIFEFDNEETAFYFKLKFC